MGIRNDTILRVLKRPTAEPLAPDVLHVVGIDDWAWQKGQHHYGTILVDLERRRVVDVLPVRTADAVAAWLAAHPDIEIISRDRHGPYADGVRRGAPQATQVADRFHLVLNLRGAVQQELSRLRPIVGSTSFLGVWDFGTRRGKAESEVKRREVVLERRVRRDTTPDALEKDSDILLQGQRRSADRRGGAPFDRGHTGGHGDEARRRYRCAT
jgi:transposase